MKHKITSKLLAVLGVITLFMVSTSMSMAQNKVTATFDKYKFSGEQETVRKKYVPGDTIQVSLSFAEGATIKINNGETDVDAVDGINDIVLAGKDGAINPVTFVGDLKEFVISWQISRPTEFKTLKVESNVLEKLTVKYSDVESVVCDGSKALKEVDLTYCESLKVASFNNCSKLESLELGAASVAQKSADGLKTVGIDGVKSLKTFNCGHRLLEGKLDFEGCPELNWVTLGDNNLEDVNFKGCSKLTSLDISHNKISKINLEGCVALTYLACNVNKIDFDQAHMMAENLPKYEGDKTGTLNFISPLSKFPPEENKMSKPDVKLLRSKNWNVNQLDDQNFSKPYSGENQTFEVTIEKSENGTIEIEDYTSADLEEVDEDTELTVIPHPAEGYKLAKLLANDEDITATLKFVVKSDVIVKATFEKGENPDPNPNENSQKYYFGGVMFDELTGYRMFYNEKNQCVLVNNISNGKVATYNKMFYDANGHMNRMDMYMDFAGTGTPKLDMQVDYTINQLGQCTGRKVTQVDTKMVMVESEIQYDEDGRMTADIASAAGIYIINRYTYDNNGNLIKQAQYSAEKKDGPEHLVAMIKYEYNEKNQRTKEILYPSITPSETEETAKIGQVLEYVYDENDCLSKAVPSAPDKNGNLTPLLEIKYKYSKDVKSDNVLMPMFAYELDAPYVSYSTLMLGMPYQRLSEGRYAIGGKKPASVGVYEYRYPTSVKDVLDDNIEVKVYPNPASDIVTVDALNMKEIKIVNLNGESVGTYPVDADRVVIPVESFARGMYIIMVKTDKQMTSKKVILK